jgi:hypothetical protein
MAAASSRRPIHCQSEVFGRIDIAGVRLDLDIEISDSTLGPPHPRRELVFVNQPLGEAIDRPLQRVL